MFKIKENLTVNPTLKLPNFQYWKFRIFFINNRKNAKLKTYELNLTFRKGGNLVFN